MTTGEQLFVQAEQELGQRRISQALELYQAAERAGYDANRCAGGRWSCHMLAGDFERAWAESDAIAARNEPDPHRFWDGQPFAGRRVMLRCLHGLGDTLQFVRFAPLVRQHAKSLALQVQPKLKQLLAQADLADCVTTWGDPEPLWDQQLEIMELPRIFRVTQASIPDRVPYIHVSLPACAERRNAQALRVGLVWASGSFNPARSIPVACLAQLFATPGVSFFSLQAGPEGAGIEPWSHQVSIVPESIEGILNTAQTIQGLDLVITVDTMTAHLAGAMGKPVWTLLPFASDWRWMLARDDSPWYPSMRLFRQSQDGDWNGTMSLVQRELLSFAATRDRTPPAASNRLAATPAREA